MLRRLLALLANPNTTSAPLVLALLNSFALKYGDEFRVVLQGGLFSALSQLLQRLLGEQARTPSGGAGGDDTGAASSGEEQASYPPRIAAWALLDFITTTLMQFSSQHRTESVLGEALEPVLRMVAQQLDVVASSMQSSCELRALHDKLDAIATSNANVAGDTSQAAAGGLVKKKKLPAASRSRASAASEAFPAPSARASKMESAVEYGVIRPAAEQGQLGESQLATGPSSRDVFAVKVIQLLLKLSSLPGGALALLSEGEGCGRPLHSLLSLLLHGSSKARVLACSALKTLLQAVADNDTRLAELDTVARGLLAGVGVAVGIGDGAAPGSTVIEFLLFCLGRSFASPLLACLALDKTACIRKMDAVERVLYSVCETGIRGEHGPHIWYKLAALLRDMCVSDSLFAIAVRSKLQYSFQVR